MNYSDYTQQHAILLENRVRKNYRHLRKRMKRANVSAYRLYDWDIPEVRVKVDIYGQHLVVSVYDREQTRQEVGYLEAMGEAAARAVDLPLENAHLRQRRTRPANGDRYNRLADQQIQEIVHEGDLKFKVNLSDYLDTGLFFDHRKTREIFAEAAQARRVLNLFSYTGAFSVAAAHGGATKVTSVDLSKNYLDWSKENFKLNQLALAPHEFVAQSAFDYLEKAAQKGRQWDLLFIDPPSFSSVGLLGNENGPSQDFDINRDHLRLLKLATEVVAPAGLAYFSTNHQRFEPGFLQSNEAWQELTHQSVPEDCRNRQAHRLFLWENQ
ncbi:MAG: class I SAM-dependent methyltransferase [Polyangiaceae bacterium]|nr:class I SAM-dependent methyltransferase [Polyangiaceae bacterium]